MTDLPPSAPRAACDALLDPNDSDPARRAELLDWLRVQAALGLRPGHACRATSTSLRSGSMTQHCLPCVDDHGSANSIVQS